jgi:hypothetical protein
MVAAAIGMGLVFVAGVVFGVVLMVATAIRREDKRKTLTQEPPDDAPHAIAELPVLATPAAAERTGQ